MSRGVRCVAAPKRAWSDLRNASVSLSIGRNAFPLCCDSLTLREKVKRGGLPQRANVRCQCLSTLAPACRRDGAISPAYGVNRYIAVVFTESVAPSCNKTERRAGAPRPCGGAGIVLRAGRSLCAFCLSVCFLCLNECHSYLPAAWLRADPALQELYFTLESQLTMVQTGLCGPARHCACNARSIVSIPSAFVERNAPDENCRSTLNNPRAPFRKEARHTRGG